MALPAVRVTAADPLGLTVDALGVGVFEDGVQTPGVVSALEALGLERVPSDERFGGRLGETLSLSAAGLPFGQVTFVGLGVIEGLDAERLRRAAGALARVLAGEAREVALTLPLVHPTLRTVRAVAEGALLGSYRFEGYRSGPESRLRTLRLVVPSSLERPARTALRRAEAHVRAQISARDLVNTPAGDLGPEELAQRAAQLCRDTCTVEVWDEERLAAERCGGILAVGQGAARPPRLLLLRYTPEDPVARVALVGKGIVFDSGGLNLKRSQDAISRMKADMAGAAAVVAVCSSLAELEVPVEVLGVCPLAENAISGQALRPGDVIRHRDATTVEVLDTDAEGRLVLADALAYAVEQQPDAIVDVATLTGSVLHAVGARATGLFATDDGLRRQLLAAAEEAGEATWPLPLWDDLEENFDSEVADLNNTGDGEHDDRAGATMGALFLRRFVHAVPWAHLDIAGSAWARTTRHHLPKGGTGTGVRTLLRWLESAGG